MFENLRFAKFHEREHTVDAQVRESIGRIVAYLWSDEQRDAESCESSDDREGYEHIFTHLETVARWLQDDQRKIRLTLVGVWVVFVAGVRLGTLIDTGFRVEWRSNPVPLHETTKEVKWTM